MDDDRLAMPALDELDRRQDTQMLALRSALGDRPVEVATAGELAAVLLRVPADTPLAAAEYVRVDADLDEGITESRTAVALAAETVYGDQPVTAVDADGRVDVHTHALAGLVIGAVRIAEQADTVAIRTVAADPWPRAIEALHTGDADTMLDALGTVVRDVAGLIDGTDDATLMEWVSDEDLAGQLVVEGNRLPQAAERLAGLPVRVVADLATPDPQ